MKSEDISMARIAVLSKDQISQCAYDLINEFGIDALTIRSIASGLGTSTAPIYTQFENIDAIHQEVIALAKDKLKKETIVKRTVDPFLNIGVGILAFALENKMIFSHYFLSKDKPLLDIKENQSFFLSRMKTNPFLTILDDQRLESLLDDMWVYTYGIATMICTGLESCDNIEYYQNKLEHMGSKLINYHLYSTGKYEEYVKLIIDTAGKYMDLEEVLKHESHDY